MPRAQLFPDAAWKFGQWLGAGMCEELRRALVEGAPPGEANAALFPLFAEYTLENFSAQVLEYRCAPLLARARRRTAAAGLAGACLLPGWLPHEAAAGLGA